MKVIGKILKILGILLLSLVLLLAAMTMGSLGEGYTFLMKLLPQSYRTADIPTELYDAMIFVYSASPITLTE